VISYRSIVCIVTASLSDYISMLTFTSRFNTPEQIEPFSSRRLPSV